MAIPLVRWTLGDVIRKLRGDETQEAFAKRAQINKSTLVRLENDSDVSQRGTLERACAALGIQMSAVYAYVEQLTWLDQLIEMEEGRRERVLALMRREMGESLAPPPTSAEIQGPSPGPEVVADPPARAVAESPPRRRSQRR